MIDQKSIAAAIRQHGARKVYKIANAAFANRSELRKIGLLAENMADVNAVQSAAFAELGDADRAIDHAQASAK
jgi:hypothetical protein